MILTGTIVNSAAIVAGSIAGLLLGKFIPERFSDAMEKGAALCVLYIGVDGMLAGENTLGRHPFDRDRRDPWRTFTAR